jgi:deaminated glutathione amidase
MQVAVVQFTAGADKGDNLARLTEQVRQAADQGADLVVCPEASMRGFGRPGDPLDEVAEPLDGPFGSGLLKLASSLDVTVIAGMFETAETDAGADQTRVYNTVMAAGPAGLIGRYRKLHLFDALGWRESDKLVAGELDDQALLTFPVGDQLIGVLTCYDLRFPELSRTLVDDGATLLALPSAWVAGPLKEGQWLTLVRARAIENTCYVAAAGQGPPEYAGHSVVVDPMGVPLVQLGDRDAIAVTEATAARVDAVRTRMPSLRHRRFAVVRR